MGVALGVLARHCEALERRGLGTATRENSREGMLLTQSEAMAVQAAARTFQFALESLTTDDAKTRSTAELEAIVLQQADEIRARKGPGTKKA